MRSPRRRLVTTPEREGPGVPRGASGVEGGAGSEAPLLRSAASEDVSAAVGARGRVGAAVSGAPGRVGGFPAADGAGGGGLESSRVGSAGGQSLEVSEVGRPKVGRAEYGGPGLGAAEASGHGGGGQTGGGGGDRPPRVEHRLRRPRALVVGVAATALVLLVGALASVLPLVRVKAKARAEAMGVELSMGRVALGWGVIRMHDVDLTIPDVPGLRARLRQVEVEPTLALGVGAIRVRGAAVRLSGSPAELREQLQRWREARAPATASASAGTRHTPVSVAGVDLVWEGAVSGKDRQLIWGARYEREENGGERFGFDLMRLAWQGSGLEVTDAEAAAARRESGRVLEKLSTGNVSAVVDLNSLPLQGMVEEPPGDAAPAAAEVDAALAGAGPAGSDNGEPGEAPAAESGSTAPAAGAATSPPSDHRGRRLHRALSRLAGALGGVLDEASRAELPGLRARIVHGAQALNVGPATFGIRRTDERVRLSLIPDTRSPSPFLLELDLPVGDGDVAVEVDGGPISLASLGVQEGDMGLINVERAQLQIRGRAALTGGGASTSFSGSTKIAHLTLEHPKLASEPVRVMGLELQGKGEASLNGERLRLEEAELLIGKLRILASGHIERGEEQARGDIRLQVPLASCQDMLESAPEGLLSPLAGMKMRGTFGFDGGIVFDTRRPDDLKITWKMANECSLATVPPEIAPRRFSRPWLRSVEGPDGVPITIESGPGAEDWVPLMFITRHMQTAILVCEDGRFWAHDGFDEAAIRSSIQDNVKAGRFMRGASTVTMQLAKNLYLGREKTLARKLQEAALTVLLEQALTKDEILELYLNVIEFGPGIFGIGPAARHYFNVHPQDLSLGQALYLGSILPNPKQHRFKEDGAVSERWMAYLHRLMRIAHQRQRITDDELEAGLEEIVARGVPGTPGEGRRFPFDEDGRVPAGHPQPLHQLLD